MAYFRKIDLEGSGGGLDADTLDGHDSSYFATSTHNHDSAYVKLADYDDADVLAKIKNVDGTGSGLDADLLDGKHAASFVSKGGGTLTGNLHFGSDIGITWGANTDYAKIYFKSTSDSDSNLIFETGDNSDEGFRFIAYGGPYRVIRNFFAFPVRNSSIKVMLSGTPVTMVLALAWMPILLMASMPVKHPGLIKFLC